MKIWVIIPAYNESQELARVLDELKQENLSVLVVDDGSEDDTYQIATDKADHAIKNEKNLGKGMSLKKGIKYLLKNADFDYVFTMDADGQHSPFDVKQFLFQAQQGENFVVGNRMNDPSGMPKLRVFINNLMSWVISHQAHQKIPDTQCGFRLIRRDVLERIQINANKFEIESEIIIKASRLGIKIKSIPVKSIYFKNRESKIRPFVDTVRFVRFMFRLRNEKSRTI
ncbi:MAG: glycosyltransferase family 2 protein [Candidatus Omnitrophica bacterium]|nr:glycosyltransferase family 2 protein [Candidatus Omnitrophota bacterium]MDD5429371.1 glycosyltransferase family 2 protein [Candidatus Omnitrophota bacterium]